MNTLTKNTSIKAIILTGFIALFAAQADAQYDPMFTQYMFNEMYVNPAYAGSRDQMSATAAYRNQWVGIEGAPETQTFSIHAPVRNKKIGVGLNIMNETIGVTQQLSIYGNYAYRVQTGDNGHFSAGLQGGVISHQEMLANVAIVDKGDAEFSANTPKLILPNAGFGLYYNTDKFYAGLSVPRMIENDVNVYEAEGSMVKNTAKIKNFHYFLTAGYVFDLSDQVKMKPTAMIKAVAGAPVEADVNFNFLLNDRVWAGVGYRTGDAFTFLAQYQLNDQLRIGYSYDYTTTELNQYSSGTHEFTIGYDFAFTPNKVVTPRYF
ncbi:MAG: type IX secretion system membrane protein PorP/SprF [Bacteroidia bacterium]|nr:type IX secretion system membrane protein PorP/SprF [Bacteroidia bacterium]